MIRFGLALLGVLSLAPLLLGCDDGFPRDQYFGTDAGSDFDAPVAPAPDAGVNREAGVDAAPDAAPDARDAGVGSG
jgi:hypothetical protein